MPRLCSLLLPAALVLVSGPALALPTNLAQIPNAPAACGTCHVSSSGSGPRNRFGRDVERNLSGGVVDWPTIAQLDSDGDGFTNGEELGDPAGTWRVGDPAPAPRDGEALSLPGVGSSTPLNPNSGPADAGDEDLGGCSNAPPSSWALTFLVWGLFLLRRRA